MASKRSKSSQITAVDLHKLLKPFIVSKGTGFCEFDADKPLADNVCKILKCRALLKELREAEPSLLFKRLTVEAALRGSGIDEFMTAARNLRAMCSAVRHARSGTVWLVELWQGADAEVVNDGCPASSQQTHPACLLPLPAPEALPQGEDQTDEQPLFMVMTANFANVGANMQEPATRS